MKIRINKNGFLNLERNGVFKPQLCPKQAMPSSESDVFCGDWCPLFGEPIADSELRLCDAYLSGEIIDERKLNGLPN